MGEQRELKLTEMLQSNVGGAEWLSKKFDAAEIEAHPSVERDRIMTKCWFKNF